MVKTLLTIAVLSSTMLGPSDDALIFHDPNASSTVERTTIRGKAIVTDGGSVLVAETSENYRQPPHHHTQEQVTIAMSGAMDLSIGGVQHHLAAWSAAIPPSDVPHFMTNNSGARTKIFEYQPVARTDWLQSNATQPPSSQPAADLPVGQTLTADLAPTSGGWMVQQNGARVKALSGKTIRVRMVDLSAATASVDVIADGPRVKRFVYVFDGKASIASGSTKRDIDRDMCVEIAPGARATISSTGTRQTMAALFEPLAPAR